MDDHPDDEIDAATEHWFLTPEERGNPASDIDRVPRDDGRGWVAGNRVEVVVHGAEYFRRLYEELCALKKGDRVYFTDWRGDPDEKLREEGPTVGEVLADLARNDVEVRALMWRSHSDHIQYNAQENQQLGEQLNEVGAEVLLDQRIRRFGSHHQKLFVIRHQGEPERDVAYVGGIDLSHGRRDDERHLGDPQQAPMDKRYSERAPWHDAALELRGPVVGDLLRTFIERWEDPTPLDRRTPYRMMLQRKAHMPRHPSELSEGFPDPEPSGRHAVQILRTYGSKRPRYPFAPDGERSIARAYEKAFSKARSLIYVEDQYFWSEAVATGIASALERSPELHMIAVVPRFPDVNTYLNGTPQRFGQVQALELLRSVAPDRFAAYDLENAHGTPIYVHAKVCIVDDVWMTCGSDNFNRRSWTNDSELTCAVIDPTPDEREPRDLSGLGDGARRLPRDLRLRLWGEHLGLDPSDPSLLDPATAFGVWRERAAALDEWHATSGGRRGAPLRDGRAQRPPGQARRHDPKPVGRLERLWVKPAYRLVFDPDDRPLRQRRSNRF